VLQVDRDLGQGDVVPLLVQPEPRLAVRAVEDGVANPARQPVDGDRVARQPDAGDRRRGDQRQKEAERQPVAPPSRPQQAQS
jgi:hypothetical protein